MSKILVPHDGSEMSDKALDKAIEFSKAFGSEIIVLHIIEDKLIPASAMVAFINERSSFEDVKSELLKILKLSAQRMLKDRLEKAEKNGIEIRFIIDIGSAAEVICDVAKNENVGLIIIGSRELEKSTWELKLLGSVARKVSEISEYPVLIIK